MDYHPESTNPPAQAPETSATTEQRRMPLSEEDRRWTLIAHYGASVLLVLTLGTCGWFAGLLTLFLKGSSPIVRAHAVESTNFQLTWGVLSTLGVVLGLLISWTCFSVFFAFSAVVSGTFALIFSLVGGKHATRGELFRYPVSFRIIQ